jgi:hypothetical protein
MKKLANVRKVVISMCVGLILAVSGVAVVSAPAQAYVANCVVGYNLNGYVGAYAHCGGGTSTWYQVRVLCQNIFTKASVVRYGPWMPKSGQYPSTISGCEHWYQAFYGTPWVQGN